MLESSQYIQQKACEPILYLVYIAAKTQMANQANWYIFSLLTIAIGTQAYKLETAAMNSIVESMPKTKHIVLYDINMLPTYLYNINYKLPNSEELPELEEPVQVSNQDKGYDT
jgi:hypothetical protein